MPAAPVELLLNVTAEVPVMPPESVSTPVPAVVIAVAVGVLALATMSTLFLVFASRRATLRLVNAGLAEISAELRQVRQLLAARGEVG